MLLFGCGQRPFVSMSVFPEGIQPLRLRISLAPGLGPETAAYLTSNARAAYCMISGSHKIFPATRSHASVRSRGSWRRQTLDGNGTRFSDLPRCSSPLPGLGKHPSAVRITEGLKEGLSYSSWGLIDSWRFQPIPRWGNRIRQLGDSCVLSSWILGGFFLCNLIGHAYEDGIFIYMLGS